jgi:hypothetical protein
MLSPPPPPPQFEKTHRQTQLFESPTLPPCHFFLREKTKPYSP